MTGLWKQAKGLQGLFRAVNKNSHWRIGMRPPRRLSENRSRSEGKPFWVRFLGHLRRIVVLFNENERKIWPKWLFRSRFSTLRQPPSLNLDLICHQNLTWLSLYVHKFDIKLTPWLINVSASLFDLCGYPWKKQIQKYSLNRLKNWIVIWQTQRLWSKKPGITLPCFCQGNGCKTQNWIRRPGLWWGW